MSTELEHCLNRVEAAFKKFDLDGDGFVSWDEFKQVGHETHSLLFIKILYYKVGIEPC